jgi:hypothetical protein
LTKPSEQKPELDPDLVRRVAAWSELPEHIRAAVLALVGTAKGSFPTQQKRRRGVAKVAGKEIWGVG